MQNIFRNALAAGMVCGALVLAPAVNAELISVDLIDGSGDGQLTRDTESNLDWLDVPLTANQTYDQVRTGLFYAQGFRHATKAELEALFIHAGIPDDGFDISVTHPTEALSLMTMLGVTLSSSDRSSAYGFTGDDYFGNLVTTENYPIGSQFSALLGKIDFLDLRSAGLGLVGEAHFTGGHPFSDEADPSYGSFLVRTTPDVCGTAGKSKNPKCKGQAQGQR
jgi:hypothetical protein